MPDQTILVVEDEFGSAEVLQLMLELEGYRVMLASHGRDALTRITTLRPDLVLTDYMMPVMSGAQLGQALRRDPTTAEVPIVMMSGVQEAEVRREFDQYDAFLPKPFRLDQLLALLRAQLGGRADRSGPQKRGQSSPADGSSSKRAWANFRLRWAPS